MRASQHFECATLQPWFTSCWPRVLYLCVCVSCSRPRSSWANMPVLQSQLSVCTYHVNYAARPQHHGSSALPVEKLPLETNQVLNSLWSSMHATEAALVAEPLLGFKVPAATWDQFQLEDPIKGEAWKTSQLERPRDDGMWACNWRHMQPTAC